MTTSIQQLKVLHPSFEFLMEDLCLPAIQDFFALSQIKAENYTKILVSVHIDVGEQFKTSFSILLQQNGMVSNPIYESRFSGRIKNTNHVDLVILLIHHLADVVFPDPSNVSINILLPNMEIRQDYDLGAEIKRSVEWYYSIEGVICIINKRRDLSDKMPNWREIAVSMSEDRKITLNEAKFVIKSHLKQLISPYVDILNADPCRLIAKPIMEPMEQALILRLMTSHIDCLQSLKSEDIANLFSYVWSIRSAATLKSKFDMLRKYLPNHLLQSIHFDTFNNEHFDIFNISEMLYYNEEIVNTWIGINEFTEDQLTHIIGVYGNCGYKDDRHYRKSVNALGVIFKSVNDHWKAQINKFFFDVSDIEELLGWSIASEQPLPELAMHGLLSETNKFKLLSKGILLQNGLVQSIPFIENASHARALCRLFCVTPDILMGSAENTNKKARIAIGELIIEES